MNNLIKIIESRIESKDNILILYDDFYNYKFNNWEKNINKFDKSNEKIYQKYILKSSNIYELILIKWNKGAETEIHRHPENGCLLKILKGSLKEERYLNDILYKTIKINDGMTSYMHDNLGQHKIIAEEESYSLHLYSPPNFYF